MSKQAVSKHPAASGAPGGNTSQKRRTSKILIIIAFGILSVLSVLVCTGIGSVRIPIPDVAKALFV